MTATDLLELIPETADETLTDYTPADTLRLAAEWLEMHEWGQGDWLCEDGSVCALGAISVIVTGSANGIMRCDADLYDKYSEAALELAKRLDPNAAPARAVFTVFDWNDVKGRTKEEVVAAMRGE